MYYQPQYTDADLELDSTDDGDDFTVDKGDTISIILPSNNQVDGFMWYLNTSELDTDVVSKKSSQYFQGGSGTTSGTEQWIFEAEDTGTTTIILEYRSSMVTGMIQYTFEFGITVED